MSHVKSHGHTLHVPEYMPTLVRKLTENCEVHWLTTWRERANDELADHLGVGKFPVITDGSSERVTSWKPAAAYLTALTALNDGREVWWIEDFYGMIPYNRMPNGVQFVDTAARTEFPVLLPMQVPPHLLGNAEVPVTRFDEPVPKHGGIFRGALQRMFSFI